MVITKINYKEKGKLYCDECDVEIRKGLQYHQILGEMNIILRSDCVKVLLDKRGY